MFIGHHRIQGLRLAHFDFADGDVSNWRPPGISDHNDIVVYNLIEQFATSRATSSVSIFDAVTPAGTDCVTIGSSDSNVGMTAAIDFGLNGTLYRNLSLAWNNDGANFASGDKVILVYRCSG